MLISLIKTSLNPKTNLKVKHDTKHVPLIN